MDRLFAVLNTAGNIVARGPAECAPDASLIKGGQYRLKFFEGEKGRADMEAIIEKQRRKVMKKSSTGLRSWTDSSNLLRKRPTSDGWLRSKGAP